MTRIAVYLPVALFAMFAVALGLGLQRDPTTLPSALIDKPMPNFSLSALREGKDGFALADLEGDVTLVNVFASWCAICRVEHPTLMQLTADDVVPIYGVDWSEPPQLGAAWLDQFGDPYLKTGSDEEGRLALDLGVSGAPETFVVDKAGRVRYKQIGAITPDVWRNTLSPLIDELRRE